MRPLIIVNRERLETVTFVVALLFDENGQQLDRIMLPSESEVEALAIVLHMAETYRIETVEVWTADSAIYVESLKRAGVFASIKHRSETKITRMVVDESAELLRELYAIEPIEPKPEPPKWRAFLISVLQRLIRKLEGV